MRHHPGPAVTYLLVAALTFLLGAGIVWFSMRTPPQGTITEGATRHRQTPARQFVGRAQRPGENESGITPDADSVRPLESFAPYTDPQRLRAAIEMSARYLARVCKPDGQFIYRINLDPSIQHDERYNILRHSGTMYAMASYCQHWEDPEVRDALVRAGQFLRQRSIEPVPGQDDMLAVWSRPEIALSGDLLQAKLGGAGLGLVGLLTLEKVIPSSTPLEELRGLGRFIVFMQEEDGEFYSKFIPDKGGRDDDFVSLYYPGEAILGLILLHELDPSPIWRNTAAKGLGYLARIRQGQQEVPADHWALLATERLLPLYEDHELPVPRKAILHHAIQVCRSIVGNQPENFIDPVRWHGVWPDGRTTPAATRLEGLLAALNFLPPEEQDLRERITELVHAGIEFLLHAQVRSGKYPGAVPRAVYRFPLKGSAEIREFNRRSTEVRIDYVQHAMSAQMQYLQMFVSPSKVE